MKQIENIDHSMARKRQARKGYSFRQNSSGLVCFIVRVLLCAFSAVKGTVIEAIDEPLDSLHPWFIFVPLCDFFFTVSLQEETRKCYYTKCNPAAMSSRTPIRTRLIFHCIFRLAAKRANKGLQ